MTEPWQHRWLRDIVGRLRPELMGVLPLVRTPQLSDSDKAALLDVLVEELDLCGIDGSEVNPRGAMLDDLIDWVNNLAGE